MAKSFADADVAQAFTAAQTHGTTTVPVNGSLVTVGRPYPSPADWRDLPIYFLLVDRFNNPAGPPRFLPYDKAEVRLQGGTLKGITARMGYLKALGVGAIWLSPVLKNSPHIGEFYGGYAIQDFLRVEPRFTSDPARAAADPAFADAELRELVDTAHAHGLHVIFDIVLNHAGDVFNYEGGRDSAPWQGAPAPEYPIFWRDGTGNANGNWTDIQAVKNAGQVIPADAAVWPDELQRNDYFRRRGADGPLPLGDFWIFKELVTEYVDGEGRYPVRDILIKAYQYLIAKFDIDGYRIDTLMYVEREFARVFGNAMREYALSIGKRNFYTFGEVWAEDNDADERIASFIGRNTKEGGDLVGVDAALDFPVMRRLRDVLKGNAPPSDLANYLQRRKDTLATIISSHGDASRYFVTFLDNHDLNDRFYYQDPADPAKYDRQYTMALTCLYCLQGVPCIYYGNEQGLKGRGDVREYAREALWGKASAFDPGHAFYQTLQQLAQLRQRVPALRYGRQYFRELSGDGAAFGFSNFKGGILAFSRVLNDREAVVVANTDTVDEWTGYAVVDRSLHPNGALLNVAFSNHTGARPPAAAREFGARRVVEVKLHPMEIQVLA